MKNEVQINVVTYSIYSHFNSLRYTIWFSEESFIIYRFLNLRNLRNLTFTTKTTFPLGSELGFLPKTTTHNSWLNKSKFHFALIS